MKYEFSEKVAYLQASAIREILKYCADPSVISFAAGSPAPDALPFKELEEISKELISEDMKYRDKQLLRLKEEVLDMEDMGDSISLTDFTLDDFRVELTNFIKANASKMEQVPEGIYAVVPSDKESLEESAKSIIKSGVIYCLRQKNKSEEAEKINPLNP